MKGVNFSDEETVKKKTQAVTKSSNPDQGLKSSLKVQDCDFFFTILDDLGMIEF